MPQVISEAMPQVISADEVVTRTLNIENPDGSHFNIQIGSNGPKSGLIGFQQPQSGPTVSILLQMQDDGGVSLYLRGPGQGDTRFADIALSAGASAEIRLRTDGVTWVLDKDGLHAG
jgi:hypothetical protein